MYTVDELENKLIDLAFAEDIGDGDHTTLCCIPENALGAQKLLVKEDGIIAGIEIAKKIFHRFDPELEIEQFLTDGTRVKVGDVAFIARGKVRSLLQTERLMLNVMQRMSGIATVTGKALIEKKGYGPVEDFGSEDPTYANVAIKVGEAVASGEYDRGILICGTGIGMSIAANKVKGAYAALVSDVYSAQRARLSNDANIMCMGAFTTGSKVRELLVEAFFENEFVKGCASQPKVDAFVEYDQNR